MPRISEEKINEILNSVDIVDVISQYIPLTRSGKNYKGICPFHEDTNPSMLVSPSRQIFKCFVCGTGGNAIIFLQKYLNISYVEAVYKLAEIAGIELPNYQVNETVSRVNEKNKNLYDMHERACQVYCHMLHTTSGLKAYEYLQSRHIDDVVIEKFQIGYASSQNYIYNAFEKLEYSSKDMALSGLVVESDYGYYDRYKERIMFPIHDEFGKVVGFSGRIFQGEEDTAKYMNSPESPIFNKSTLLYNYHRAREAIKKAGFVYLLEGFMDVIALSRIGIDNTLALMGTALTKEHVSLIRKVTNNVHICLDGDNAGKSAALKASRFLKSNNFHVSMISLMNGLDPDEILEQFGADTLRISLETIVSPIDFELEYLYSQSNMANYEERKEFLQKACALIVNVEDSLDYHHYMHRISSMSSFEEEYIEEYMRTLQHQKQSNVSPAITYAPSKNTHRRLNKYQKAERYLLYYMLHDKKVSAVYENKIGFMYEDKNRIAASYIVDYYRNHEAIQIASFINTLNDNELVDYILEVYDEDLPKLESLAAVDDYIETIRQHARALEIADLKKQMARELDALNKAKLAKRILEIQTSEEE